MFVSHLLVEIQSLFLRILQIGFFFIKFLLLFEFCSLFLPIFRFDCLNLISIKFVHRPRPSSYANSGDQSRRKEATLLDFNLFNKTLFSSFRLQFLLHRLG